MKALLFVVFLVLSLPNLLAGMALAVVERTFMSRHPLEIILHFLESVVWGVPVAAGVLLLLLLAGIITDSRPYAAVCALLLNVVALALVLWRLGPPPNMSQGVVFIPLLIALGGFGWIACGALRPPSAEGSSVTQ